MGALVLSPNLKPQKVPKGSARVEFIGKQACRMLGRRIFFFLGGGSSWKDKISEGAESDVRKRDRGAGRPGGEGIRPHLFSVSCFHSWLPVEIPGMCMGRLEQAVSMTCLI